MNSNIKIKKLCDCATIIAGQSPESKYYNSDGDGVPFFQGKADFGEKYPTVRIYCSKPTKLAEKDDILLSVRAPVGPTNLSPGKVCIGRGLSAIRPHDELNLFYLMYYFKYFEAQLSAKGTGTTFKAITQSVLKNLEIPVPSLPEQEQIVEKIEELFSDLDNAVETLNTTKTQLANYKESVIREAFTGAFTINYRKTVHPKINANLPWIEENQLVKLPLIPNEWKYVELVHLGELGRGKSKHRPRNDSRLFDGGIYPFLQTGEVKAATKYVTDYSKSYNEFGLSQSKLWPKGTLCITIAANIAETAFLGIDACFPDSVVGFVPSGYILPEYIRYFIESQKARLSAFAPATAQKNINLTTLENLIIPYCDITEQGEIVNEIEARLSVYHDIELTVEDALGKATSMRQSILKQAFEGKL